MPAPYRYAAVRLVPRVDREEFINVGVILCSPERRFLRAATHLHATRVEALWPAIDLLLIERHLHAITRICAGDRAAGAVASLSLKERFHWLVAPRSTVIQTSPVRTGLSDALDDELQRLRAELVAP